MESVTTFIQGTFLAGVSVIGTAIILVACVRYGSRVIISVFFR